MSALPIEWIDPEEFAAIEDACAAAGAGAKGMEAYRTACAQGRPRLGHLLPCKRMKISDEKDFATEPSDLPSSPIAESGEVGCCPKEFAAAQTADGYVAAGSFRRLPKWVEANVDCGNKQPPSGYDCQSQQEPAGLSGDKFESDGISPKQCESDEDKGNAQCQLSGFVENWQRISEARLLVPSPRLFRDFSKRKLPYLQFRGHIVYSNTGSDAEAASQELLQIIETRRALQIGPIPVGFDTEWKVIFKRGMLPRKAAVLQLCLDSDRCYVFHIVHSGIPNPLRSLLEDSSIFKVGVCSHGDAAKLQKDYNVNSKGIVDLRSVANYKLRVSATGNYHPKNWSLSSLSEELTGKQVEKANSVRTGDWEACTLSQSQLQYAATDAFVSWHLYQVLMTFPDHITDDKDSSGLTAEVSEKALEYKNPSEHIC